MALGLVVLGFTCLVAFAWFVWAPLAFLVLGVELTAAGLLVDWEKLRGEPASPHRR